MSQGKRAVEPISDGPITLRLLDRADLPMTRAWRNHDQIRRWFLHSDPLTVEQHEQWFERYRERDDDFVFVIEEHERLNRPIGQVSLYGIDWDHRHAKFGRLMVGDAEARGRGLARRAVELLIRHGEDSFGLEELRLEVLPGNGAAISIYERCGFTMTEHVDGEIRMVRRSGRTAK